MQDYVQHTLASVLWRTADQVVLVVANDDLVLKGKVLARGEIIIRYAIPYLGRSHLSIVPTMFVSERGVVMYAWKAWKFMWANYQLYPRAEIFGLQSDGETAQVFLRELDFGVKARVYAYDTIEARLPIAQIHRVISNEPIPTLLKELLIEGE